MKQKSKPKITASMWTKRMSVMRSNVRDNFLYKKYWIILAELEFTAGQSRPVGVYYIHLAPVFLIYSDIEKAMLRLDQIKSTVKRVNVYYFV